MLRRLMMAGGGNPDLPWTARQIHFDAGTGGSGVLDSSPFPKSPSLWSGGLLSTDGPKFGAKCLDTRSPGAEGAGLIMSGVADIVVGTGDFCYDFWVNLDSVGYEQVLLSTISTSSGANGFYLDYHPATYKLLHYSPVGGGLHYNASNGVITASSYQHIEYSRTSGTGYLFLDGNLVTSFADTNNYTTDTLLLGGITYTPVGAVPAAGRFDEFRILVGRGGHTSSFTPPTVAYGDT